VNIRPESNIASMTYTRRRKTGGGVTLVLLFMSSLVDQRRVLRTLASNLRINELGGGDGREQPVKIILCRRRRSDISSQVHGQPSITEASALMAAGSALVFAIEVMLHRFHPGRSNSDTSGTQSLLWTLEAIAGRVLPTRVRSFPSLSHEQITPLLPSPFSVSTPNAPRLLFLPSLPFQQSLGPGRIEGVPKLFSDRISSPSCNPQGTEGPSLLRSA
jgi:hypothetical protein